MASNTVTPEHTNRELPFKPTAPSARCSLGPDAAARQREETSGSINASPPDETTSLTFACGAHSLVQACGIGSHSIVYEVNDIESGATRACKVTQIRKKLRSKASSAHVSPRIEDAISEASIIQSFDHPNIVGYVDMTIRGNVCYLLLEMIRGLDLSAALAEIRGGRLFESDARCVIRQLLFVLKHIHERGVVHRDVKMENIMVVHPEDSGFEKIKLCDFGVAARVSDAASNANFSRVVGTTM